MGTVIVDGANSQWANNQNLYVGYSGTGFLAITNGGTVSSSLPATIGQSSGSSGTVTVDGACSTWAANDIYVGFTGNGMLNVTNGATVRDASGIISLNLLGGCCDGRWHRFIVDKQSGNRSRRTGQRHVEDRRWRRYRQWWLQ